MLFMLVVSRRIARAVLTAATTKHCATVPIVSVRSLSSVIVGDTITNLCCKTKRESYDSGCRISTIVCDMMRSSSLGAGDIRITRHFGSSSVVVEDDESTSDDLRNEIEEIELMAEVKEANERCLGNIHIKKVNPNQWGVFTSRPFTKGSIVISSTPLDTNTTNNSCSHSIQIDSNKVILMDLPARFLNHSCGPNIGVGKRRRSKEEEEKSSRSNMNMNEKGSYDFVALGDIDEGEEVRFDYETTEYEVGAFYECHCGDVNCRGTIRGYKYNSDVINDKYGRENVAEYLLRDR